MSDPNEPAGSPGPTDAPASPSPEQSPSKIRRPHLRPPQREQPPHDRPPLAEMTPPPRPDTRSAPEPPKLRDLDQSIEAELEAALEGFSADDLTYEPEKPAQPAPATGGKPQKRGRIIAI